MTSRKKIVQFLKTPFYLALYTLTGACLVLALAWVDLAVAQSRLSVISVVVQKVSVTPRLGFAQASVTLTVGDAVGNPALSDQPASKGAITYRSSDDAIARVAADGTVTAVAAGSATISATQAADLPGFEAGAGSYQVTVAGPLSASANFTSRSWLVGVAVGADVVPVSGGGGIGKLHYAVTPALPAGLEFSVETGAVTGSALVPSPLTDYTVTVTDSGTPPGAATARFSLAIGAALLSTVNRATWVAQAGDPLNDTPVSAVGGIGTLGYAVAPALPAGLTMDASTGAITGSAAMASPRTEYTVTVTDGASPSHEVSANFTLEIRGLLTAVATPSGTTDAVVGRELSYQPVTAAGGVGALHYSVSPALPAGLALDEATGMLTGAAVAVAPLTTYAVTVTDSDSPAHTVTASFMMEVGETISVTSRVDAISVTAGDPVTVAAPVEASGGVGARHFEISPALPAGLALDASDGGISGSAVGESAETVYTVTVSDSVGQRASSAFSLRVFPILQTNVPNAGEVHRVHDTVSYTPALTWGGVPPYRYSVTPALPAGLALNAGTGAITGVTTTPSLLATYTYTVTDSAMPEHSAKGTFSLLVVPALTAATVKPAVSIMVDAAIVDEAPVNAVGGLGLLHFSVQPPLPDGLQMEERNGKIKNVPGTPIAVSPATEYTVTVTDSADPLQTVTATFTLAVHGNLAAALNQPYTTQALNEPLTAYAPVTASGGVGPLSYDVAPPLPDGLTMDRATGVISGTPTVEQLDTNIARYTVTISDTASPAHTVQERFGLLAFERPTANVRVPVKAYMIGDAVSYSPVQGGGAGGRKLEYRMLHGGLPAGLTMDSTTGEITGTALEVSPSNTFAVAISDPLVEAVPTSAFFNLEIAPALAVQLTSDALAGPAVGEPDVTLDSFVTVSGGVGDVAMTAALGVADLLEFTKAGTDSRAPRNLRVRPGAAPGMSSAIKVTVTDAAGHAVNKIFTVTWP